MKTLYFIGLIALPGLIGCESDQLPDDVALALIKVPEVVDYNLHVKPILSDRCFKCHGPDKNKIEAGLQLASFEGATKPLKSGTVAIDPGHIGGSELIKRILSHDPDEIMPTPKSNLTLSSEEKAILVKWIKQGATYKQHWSLSPIQNPEVPRVGEGILARWGLTEDGQTRWIKNDIDRFTLAKMTERGMKPSPEAAKSTLLRRVYMDLTGLPPTPAEVIAYEQDTRPDAYERVVDRLLNSPHFGEHQAVSWLDLARFADSQGYQDDPMRNAYPYRDWVIRAFNQNRPFDQFITEQLAGDLLPGPVTPAVLRDRLVATSFNRQHAQSGENGIVPEEYRIEYVADRTNTLGKAMLGLTMECCRCHDHKYDPISHKDYYSLFAFFNQNKETGQITHNGEAVPTVMLPAPDVEKQLQFIRSKIKAIELKLRPDAYRQSFANGVGTPKTNLTINQGLLVHLPFDAERNPAKKNYQEFDETYRNTAKSAYKAFVNGDKARKPQVTTGKLGSGVRLQGDCGIGIVLDGVDQVNGNLQAPRQRFGKGLNFERNQPFSVSIWTNILEEGVQGAIFRRSNYKNEGYRGYSVSLNPDRTLRILLSYVWPANCIELKTRHQLPLCAWQNITLTYAGNGKANGVRLFINGRLAPCELVTDNLTKSLLHGPFGTNKSGQLPIFEIGNEQSEKTLHNVDIDELRIYNRQLSVLEVQSLVTSTDAVTQLLAIPAHRRSSAQQQQLLEQYVFTTDSTFAACNREATALRGQEANLLIDIPEVMTMQELPDNQTRKTFILKRGVFDAPGEAVTAEIPQTLGQLPPGYPRNRLGLARWLLTDTNPLFARVMVNRFWQQYFGNGLVKTQEDFGNQGELPSHPELLDWLATQFKGNGDPAIRWNVKAFIRQMVLSATYRQSSQSSGAVTGKNQSESDIDNKWLSRGSGYRYTAEQIRDNVLMASGLLVQQVGGPSVYPYQPSGIWEALATRNTVRYRQQHGDSLYRRSMYTILKRTSPPPMMLNFDAPDRTLCTVRRQKTATPQQALVALNDPQFVEAARVLAERTMRRMPTIEQRIAYFFLAILSRQPRPREVALLRQLYTTEHAYFTQHIGRAESLLKIGEFPADKSLNPVDVASYAIVANTLFNYDEALVKR